MGFGRLGAHVNLTVNGLPEAVAEWKPPLVVLLDHSDVWHSVKAESPDTVFIGRVVRTDEPDFSEPALDPIAAARKHCDIVLPWAERMGETYDLWQGINEPIVHSDEAMRRLAAFDAEQARIMDRHGFRVVVGSFSVGNPRLRLWQQFLPALEAAKQFIGALALHQYAWPTLDHEAPWYLLRHRKVYDGEPSHGWEGLPAHLKSIPLFITECGLDGLIAHPHQPKGWRAIASAEQYLQQLAFFDSEIRQDTYVQGAAIYCMATPDVKWKSYDIWPEPARTLSHRARCARASGPPPSRPSPGLPGPHWHLVVEHLPGAPIIAGSLPEAGIQVAVTDQWGNVRITNSGAKPEFGPGGFEVLAPVATTYTIAFLDQEFSLQTRGGTTLLTLTPSSPPPPAPPEPGPPPGPLVPPEPAQTTWQMTVQRRPGVRILAGSFPEAGIELTASDPWGNSTRVVSGSKPEYGVGGFEVLSPHITTIRLAFLQERFEVQSHDGVTLLTFHRLAPEHPAPLLTEDGPMTQSHHARPTRHRTPDPSTPPAETTWIRGMLGRITTILKRFLERS